MIVKEALEFGASRLAAAQVENPRTEAELLMAHALGRDRLWLVLHRDLEIGDAAFECYRSLLIRKGRHEPTAYILGRKEFWDYSFIISRNTLIPRPETELIIELAREVLDAKGTERPCVLDLGTGSGILAVTLAGLYPGAYVVAVDFSEAAIRIAQENARAHGVEGRISFVLSDWLIAFAPRVLTVEGERHGNGGFDIVVSNPPYIAENEMPSLAPSVRDFEPETALVGGADGLDALSEIILQVPDVLRPGGWLFCEIGRDQGEQVLRLAATAGAYSTFSIRKDLSGNDRLLSARRARGD